jgi:hypothetical protein
MDDRAGFALRDGVEERRQHEGVVSLRARPERGERGAAGVGQEVVLGAETAPCRSG